MFGRSNGASGVVADAAETLSPYAESLAHDDKLRRRLAAAIGAGLAAQQRARRHAGFVGLATRLGSDPVLRAQILEAAGHLQAASKRMQKRRSRRGRTVVLLLGGAGVAVLASPKLRTALTEKLGRDRFPAAAGSSTLKDEQKTVEQEIEVAVPVTTAYNQWTQFEEFPKFMEGVEEVKQLDDTLLHWAVKVAGKKAEWNAKIVEQQPDRRISWESVDGKRTRGTVTFEPAGPSRTRIRLHMSYLPQGTAEKVGSSAGLDDRRVRGDLERFRELIESRQTETGAWRGEVAQGQEKQDGNPS
jgi:uncharacterized membrane protein